MWFRVLAIFGLLRVIQINRKLWKFLKVCQEPPKSTLCPWRCSSNISTTAHLACGWDDRKEVRMSWGTTGGSLCVTRIQSRELWEIHLGHLSSFLFDCNKGAPLYRCFLAHSTVTLSEEEECKHRPSLGGRRECPSLHFPKCYLGLTFTFS